MEEKWWLDVVHPRVVSAREEREDPKTKERLAAEASDEAYMAELRHLYPEQVEAELKMLLALFLPNLPSLVFPLL